MALRQTGVFRLDWIAWAMALVFLVASPAGAQAPAVDTQQQQWKSLNAQAAEAYLAGDYSKATALLEKELGLARQVFGDRAPETQTSLNNLAALYQAQGRLDGPDRSSAIGIHVRKWRAYIHAE